ncbi:shikimate 5-dehydrogenase, partial [mine drainage metagenome]
SVMTQARPARCSGPSAPAWGAAWVYARLPTKAADDPPVEATQLPVDDLLRFFEAGPDAPLFALLGRPVAHSISPRLHGGWMRRAGRAGLYLPLEIGTADELAVVVRRLPALGFRGANVTHPWKEAALGIAVRATASARECGVANCLTFDADGPSADNTDVAAAEQRLGELRDVGHGPGGTVVVLGSGGAARASVVAARRIGARPVVYGRNPAAVDRIVRELGAERGDLSAPRPAPLVVHATSVGREPADRLAVPLSALLAPGGYLLDWVYGAPDGEVARAAARAGAGYEGGERLLALQAARSYERWWGAPPPAEGAGSHPAEVACAA